MVERSELVEVMALAGQLATVKSLAAKRSYERLRDGIAQHTVNTDWRSDPFLATLAIRTMYWDRVADGYAELMVIVKTEFRRQLVRKDK